MKRSNFKGGTRRTWLEKHHWQPPPANAAIEWDPSLHNHHIALLLFWDVFWATVQLSCSSVPCCIRPVWCHAADTPHWWKLWQHKFAVQKCCAEMNSDIFCGNPSEALCCDCVCRAPAHQCLNLSVCLFIFSSRITTSVCYCLNICVLHILSSMFFFLGWQSWAWSSSSGADSWDIPQAHI